MKRKIITAGLVVSGLFLSLSAHAWAVHDRNPGGAAVPVPAPVWLFGSTLGLLGWIRRKAAYKRSLVMPRLTTLIYAGIVWSLCPVVGFSASLTTSFVTNNSASANVFDVISLGNSLLVTSLELNLSDGTHTIALYTKPGTWVGSDNTAGDWTLVDTVTDLVSNGPDSSTLAVFADFQLSASSTTGFYLTLIDPVGSNDLLYSTGTGVGNILASNSDLEILEGAGKQADLFSGITFTPRSWSGTINYTVIPVPPALFLFGSALGLLAWTRRKSA
jgi:hypothetical protein